MFNIKYTGSTFGVGSAVSVMVGSVAAVRFRIGTMQDRLIFQAHNQTKKIEIFDRLSPFDLHSFLLFFSLLVHIFC